MFLAIRVGALPLATGAVASSVHAVADPVGPDAILPRTGAIVDALDPPPRHAELPVLHTSHGAGLQCDRPFADYSSARAAEIDRTLMVKAYLRAKYNLP